ncbi:hypothetical protein Cni_G09821 [Canna indica]|uniref:Uncharacterized protein n=1 Tax=Canna indica TaxID=4628 RepID=A0AAQ3Q9Q7_9LILI|nr:hypothetical protein Cni_G09821 [Canna indica]
MPPIVKLLSSTSCVLAIQQVMLTPKRLLGMARKWQKRATLGRKRVTWMSNKDASPEVTARNTMVADKGHFVVYSYEGKRFMVPLAFLNSGVFQDLLRLTEEEFGFSGDGPILLPCDVVLLEYILSLLKRRGSKEAEREMLISSFMRHCSKSTMHSVEHSQ